MTVGSIRLLICALGGEGGGVLADWITQAAVAEGLAASRTSVPGVAQRTGATSYYVEVARQPGPAPVMALNPAPGRLDIVVASEWLEAGRAMLRGFVTPDRTLLIASTHRVYTIAERSAPGDGRFESARVQTAAAALARRLIAADFAAAATAAGARLNAVLLGALAASDALPIADATFQAVIGEGGNRRGFEAGKSLFATGGVAPAAARQTPPPTVGPAFQEAWTALPPEARPNAAHGLARLTRYQGAELGRRYLERLAQIAVVGGDGRLCASVAARLAVLMSPDDVVQVAREKVRPERLAALRREAGAARHEPIRIVEHLKPGLEELVVLLPAPVGRALWRRVTGSRWLRALAVPMRLTTTSLLGWITLRAIAAAAPLRQGSFGEWRRMDLVDRWMARIVSLAPLCPDAAVELAEAAGLVKGYAATLSRTTGAFETVLTAVADPLISGEIDPRFGADALLQARLAGAKDDGGRALSALIASLPMRPRPSPFPEA